jgi:hypothetical protein
MAEQSGIPQILFVFGCIWISVSIICYGCGIDRWYCLMGATIGAGKMVAGMALT